MKLKLLALLPLLHATHALAGTDTLVRFVNMSPYQVTVSFADPDTGPDCWHDTTGLADGRIGEYARAYDRDAVSDDGYKDYLRGWKAAFGTGALLAAGTTAMDGTAVLAPAPAVSGAPVSAALFQGETSANLFEGCKDKTSSRRFAITLKDAAGQPLSRQVYQLTDPPGGAWTLVRVGAQPASITLGQGGKAHALDIALTAGTVVVTAVSLGSAASEAFAARALIVDAVQGLARWGIATESAGRAFFNYLLVGRVRAATATAAATIVRSVAGSTAARLVYTSVVDGAIQYFRPSVAPDGTPGAPTPLPDADLTVDADALSSPQLQVMAGLPDDRSICAYETTTLGIRECRLVGLNLSVMPDGSLVFAPLPAVGSGG